MQIVFGKKENALSPWYVYTNSNFQVAFGDRNSNININPRQSDAFGIFLEILKNASLYIHQTVVRG